MRTLPLTGDIGERVRYGSYTSGETEILLIIPTVKVPVKTNRSLLFEVAVLHELV